MDMESLQHSINYTFKNKRLLKLALTHPSSRIKDADAPDNQRLEFLGDAVLQLVVSRYLFEKYPDDDEGWLTSMRVKLVCRDALVKLAKSINLGRYLKMSSSMSSMGGRENAHNLEDAFEALVAAIYLDSDLDTLTKIIFTLYSNIPDMLSEDSGNSKGALQELLQAQKLELPEYKLLSSSGPAHDRTFEIGLYINDKQICKAVAGSKKSAEQLAAKKALQILRKDVSNEA